MACKRSAVQSRLAPPTLPYRYSFPHSLSIYHRANATPMRQKSSLSKALWILTIGTGILVATVSAWLLQPEWPHTKTWQQQGAQLDALESLTGGVLLPATPQSPLPFCSEKQREATLQEWSPYLQRYQIEALFIYREGCLEMASADFGERKPVFGLFNLWGHLLQGVAVSRQLIDAENAEEFFPSSAYPDVGQPLSPDRQSLVDALEQLAWSTPIRRLLADVESDALPQWAGQRLALKLEILAGQPFQQLLQNWIRTPLEVGSDAVLALDSIGAPLAFCCYYASAEEVIRLGRVYLGEHNPALGTKDWNDRLAGRYQLAPGSYLFKAHGQYLYWNIQYGVLIYLRTPVADQNDINYLIELMSLLAQSPASGR